MVVEPTLYSPILTVLLVIGARVIKTNHDFCRLRDSDMFLGSSPGLDSMVPVQMLGIFIPFESNN